MDKKRAEPAENEEGKVTVRHTITAEEAFTLAKDAYDIRCLIKNIYANRALIARRLNLFSITVSAVFTLLYAAYLIVRGFISRLALGWEIAVYVLLGVYVALLAAIVAVTLLSRGAKTRDVRRISAVLKYCRLAVRLLSLAISIAALTLAVAGGEYTAPNIAVDAVIIVFSIIVLIFQIIPLLFGGFGRLARWLLSPVKVRYTFSSVVLEWYELAVNGTGKDKNRSVKKVAKKHFDDIGRVTDEVLLPALGKKYINTIKPAAVLNAVARAAEEDRAVAEGVLKSVFAYAVECGYVTFDPCRDLNLEGSVEEQLKPKKKMKDRLFGVGKKIGLRALDKYIASTSDDGDESR